MANDFAGFGGAGDNHVSELDVPPLVIVAAHHDGGVFVEKLGPGNGESTFSGCRLDCVRVLVGPNADDGDTTSRINQFGDGFRYLKGVFFAVISFGTSLETNGVDCAGHAP